MKNHLPSFTLFIALSLILFQACDEDFIIDDEMTQSPTGSILEFYETTIRGRIVDEEGFAVSNATISAGTNGTISDQNGFFSLPNIDAPSTGLYIKVEAPNFHTGGDHFYPIEISTYSTVLRLVEKEIATFDATEGINLAIQAGSSISILPGTLEFQGMPYDGPAILSLHQINHSSQLQNQFLPADTRAITDENESVYIDPVSTISVALNHPNGDPIRIREGSIAQLNISADNASNTSLNLLSLDQDNGTWAPKGTVTKTGTVYETEIDASTWWMIGSPMDLSQVCLRIEDLDGNQIENQQYCIISSTGNIVSCRNSFSNSSQCHLVPSNDPLFVEFFDACGVSFNIENIGSFDNDISDPSVKEEVVVRTNTGNTQDVITLFGLVSDCDGNPLLGNGAVSVRYGEADILDFDLDPSGYELDFIDCDITDVAEVTVYDFTNLSQNSIEVDISDTSEPIEANISACGEPIEVIFILDNAGQSVIIDNCRAVVSGTETLIIATQDENENSGILLGFRGFSTGNFTGNLIAALDFRVNSGASSGQVDQTNVTISEYGANGAFIQGSFEDGNITGSFIARRVR